MPADEEFRRQLKPGPKNVGPRAYLRKPPGVTVQKTFRADPDALERVEERALEETMRTGQVVRFSDLMRRAIDLLLATPLPGRPARARRCNVVPNAVGGTTCLECRRHSTDMGLACPDDKE